MALFIFNSYFSVFLLPFLALPWIDNVSILGTE